jgi:hypothetical protein
MLWTQAVVSFSLFVGSAVAKIERETVLQQYLPERKDLNHDMPISLGNGNFAFNVDITGLQTIRPFNTLSGWAWHEFPRPQEFQHKRAPPLDQSPISAPDSGEDWETQNPHRFNLGRIGLLWDGAEIPETAINNARQKLNISSGRLTSQFSVWEIPVTVESIVSPSFDAISFSIRSEAFLNASLSIFFDYPYPSLPGQSPYLGVYSSPEEHKTTLEKWGERAQIKHTIDSTTYYTNLNWNSDHPPGNFTRLSPIAHRYSITPSIEANSIDLTASFSATDDGPVPSYEDTRTSAALWWSRFWMQGAFVSCKPNDKQSPEDKKRVTEFMRRVLMSQFLLATNAAGTDPPGITGLVDLAGAGKVDLRDTLWTLGHWERWNKWERIGSAIPVSYARYLSAAKNLASTMGSEGVRWGDFVGPDGRAVGDGGDLWAQVHPLWFAETEWNRFPEERTVKKWKEVVELSSEYMLSLMKKNGSSGAYNLEVTLSDGNVSLNPVAETAYWRFGLDVAKRWYERSKTAVPKNLAHVLENMSDPETRDGKYVFDPRKLPTRDPANPLLLLGVIPPLGGNSSTYTNTISALTSTFASIPIDNTSFIMNSWSRPPFGLTFPLLSLAATRLGDADAAVSWLLDEQFSIDDAGMTMGLGRVLPTPYLPSSGALLLAVAEMAEKKLWPKGWSCQSEGFGKGFS